MTTNYVVFSDAGLPRAMAGGKTYLNTLKIRLFVNNVTPTHTSAADASWATEASFPGYAAQTLLYADPVTNAQPPDADAIPALTTFTATAAPTGGTQTIYGWYVTDPADGKWIFASLTNKSPAQTIQNTGDFYAVQARLTAAPYAAYP